MDPIIHYLYHGYKERKNPSKNFDGNFYLEYYNLENSDINPLVHYLLYGVSEGKKIKKEIINEKYIDNSISFSMNKSSSFIEDNSDFSFELNEEDIKLIAFYLPQFHPIPENDKWWGKGFTEWTNVTKAIPNFEGHNQPHLPIDVGFYDLRLPETQRRQIELAKKYGVYGFCYYYYWFNGKRLLETPLNNFLNDSSLDFPFCLCWANENWSRRWDGLDKSILIKQEYSSEDDLNIIEDLRPYLEDERYIKIGEKLLLMVYKPQLLPNPKKTFKLWKEYSKSENIGELFLVGADRQDFLNPEEYGLDASYEFPPNKPHPTYKKEVNFIKEKNNPKVYDMEKFVSNKAYMEKTNNYLKFKGIFPAWDNTPRRNHEGQVYLGNPSLYSEWLLEIIKFTKENLDHDHQFIFINAWNEWAEGAHLEPDRKFGYAYLRATSDAIIKSRDEE